MDTSVLWGAAFSVATSIFKALGLPERWAFLVNIAAALIYSGALISQGTHWRDAMLQAFIALGASYGTYKLLSKPVRELVQSAPAEPQVSIQLSHKDAKGGEQK